MVKRHFSTGLSRLDKYIGGIFSSDIFLSFVPEVQCWQKIVDGVAAYAQSSNIPIVYVSVDDSLGSYFVGLKKYKCITTSERGKRGSFVRNSIKRSLTLLPTLSYIIIDELSKWKEVLSTEKRVVDLYEYLSSIAIRKKSVLICAAHRASFQVATLITLKDISSICLDFVVHQDDFYCLPLNLKGRYIQRGVVPLRIKRTELMHVSEGRDATNTSEVRRKDLTEKQFTSTILPLDERYEKMFEHAGEAMVLFDPAGTYREVNRRMEELLGYSSDELTMLNPLHLISSDYRFSARRFLLELRKKRRHSVQLTVAKKNGKTIQIEFHASNLGNGLALGILRDISDRLKIEEVLREREQEYRTFVDHSPYGILLVDNGNPLYANQAFYTLFAYQTSHDVLSSHLKDFFMLDSYKTFQRILKKDQVGQESRKIELVCLRKDGTPFDSQVTVTETFFHNKKCLQLCFIDISEQKEILNKLVRSEQQYHIIVEQSHEPVAVLENGQFIYCSQAFLTLFAFDSVDQVIGQMYSIVIDEADRDRITDIESKRSHGKKSPLIYQYAGIRRDCKKLTIEVSSILENLNGRTVTLAFHRDITEKTKLEQQLQQHVSAITILKEITSAANTSDLRKLLQSITQKVMDLLSWEMGAVYLAEETSKELRLEYHRHFPEKIIQKLSSLSHEDGIGGLASKTKEPHIFTLATYPSYLPFRALFRDARIRDICFLPLVAGEKLVGLLMLGSRNKTSLSTSSVEFLSTVGVQLGTAITNLTSYDQLKEFAERYRGLIESVSDILYMALPNGSIYFLSSAIEQIAGYKPREFYRNPSLWLALVHNEDKKILLERIAHLNELGDRLTKEYRILP
ncbi:MAG: PAS domain S-box protein [Ignavibacteriae bacterium]|nr:PAS domain S-box protein [Ignavibacteriota bacterium]